MQTFFFLKHFNRKGVFLSFAVNSMPFSGSMDVCTGFLSRCVYELWLIKVSAPKLWRPWASPGSRGLSVYRKAKEKHKADAIAGSPEDYTPRKFWKHIRKEYKETMLSPMVGSNREWECHSDVEKPLWSFDEIIKKQQYWHVCDHEYFKIMWQL